MNLPVLQRPCRVSDAPLAALRRGLVVRNLQYRNFGRGVITYLSYPQAGPQIAIKWENSLITAGLNKWTEAILEVEGWYMIFISREGLSWPECRAVFAEMQVWLADSCEAAYLVFTNDRAGNAIVCCRNQIDATLFSMFWV